MSDRPPDLHLGFLLRVRESCFFCVLCTAGVTETDFVDREGRWQGAGGVLTFVYLTLGRAVESVDGDGDGERRIRRSVGRVMLEMPSAYT